MNPADWEPRRQPPPLDERAVHVWRVPLGADPAPTRALLCSDERERAARFHFERDARRYTLARATLRRLLGAYTARDPASLRFDYGEHDKPELAGGEPPSFNVSHSGDLALIAVTPTARVGVDTEELRELGRLEDLARRFFAPAETEALLALPPDRQQRAFFAVWTRKEAYLKALGAGLSLPLASFEVAVDPDAPARLVKTSEGAGPPGDWTLADLDVGLAARAALACAARGCVLRRLRELG